MRKPEVGSDRPEIWGITLTEMAPCWLELRARGLAGHSAAPTKDTAVPRWLRLRAACPHE